MDLTSYTPLAPFAQKHLLTLADYTKDEILQILTHALKLKRQNYRGLPHHLLKGQTLGMIFAKSSTRTLAVSSIVSPRPSWMSCVVKLSA